MALQQGVSDCSLDKWLAKLSPPVVKCSALLPFVFEQELELSGDAKQSSADKGHSHPISGLP